MRTTRTLTSTAALTIALAALTSLAPAAHAEPPLNDEPATASVVPSVPFEDTLSTVEASTSDVDGCGAASVWYSYTPDQDEDVLISTAGSDYDTMLGLHQQDGEGVSALECVDDVSGSLQARLRAHLTAGTTYLISAGTCCGAEPGAVGPGGRLVLRMSQALPPLTSVDARVTRVTVARSGQVTVSGTVQCDQPGHAGVSVRVSQTFGRLTAIGDGYRWGECGPVAATWTADITSSTGVRFGPGQATLTGSASAQDEDGAGSAYQELTSRRVKLARSRTS